MQAARFVVSGVVQGVWYRASTVNVQSHLAWSDMPATRPTAALR